MIDPQLSDELKELKELLSLHEHERRLLAYEIHDGFVQLVAASLMRLEAIGQSPVIAKAPFKQDFFDTLELLRESVADARRVISGLRPALLDEAGLVPAVEQLVSQRQASGFEIQFKHQLAGPRLPPLLEHAVFRIVQEALTNVKRHGRGGSAQVALEEVDGSLRVEVRDDGAGFDPAKVGPDHYGLRGIQERARLLGGQSTIQSRPGEGTVVRVELPLARSTATGKPPAG